MSEEPEKPTIRRVSTLQKRVGPAHAGRIAAILDAVSVATQERHDQKRARVGRLHEGHALAGSLEHRYERPTGAEALAAGISSAVLSHLGHGEDPIRPESVFDDVFTLRLGPHIVWGSAETGCFVLLSEPMSVYR